MEHSGVPIDMEIFPPARRQEDLARSARRHGAGDRRAIRRLCPQRGRRLDLQHGALRAYLSARASSAGRCWKAASSTCGARLSRTWPRPSRSSKSCANCATPATRCARSSWRSARRPKPHSAVAVQAKTSRTQPKASQWIFSPAVWLRSLIKPGARNGGRLHRLFVGMEFLMARRCRTATAGRPTPCSICTKRRSVSELRQARRRSPARRQRRTSARGRCATGTRSCCWPSSTACDRDSGRPARHLDLRSARNAQPAP